MKNNVVVLVNEIYSDYSKTILDGITGYLNCQNVNIIIANARIPQTKEQRFTVPSYSSLKLSEAKDINGIIIVTPPFCSNLSVEEIQDYFGNLYCNNILSISVPLKIKNTIQTSISCQKAYEEIITHLHKTHGCTKIAFMSANSTGSKEALERYDAFLQAINKEGLIFDEKLLFEGKYVYDCAFNNLKEAYKTKEEVNFDAILAANDMMAFGCIDYLSSLGIKIPEDVKVFGFDDIEQAQTAELPLSTINQQIQKQGETAARIIMDKINGNKVLKNTPIEIKPIYRKSCGCNSYECEDELHRRVFSSNTVFNNSVKANIQSYVKMQSIYFLLESIQNEITLDELFKTFNSILPVEKIPGIAVCLFDEPVLCENENPLKLPNKVKLVFYTDKEENVIETPNEYFNPKKEILPAKYFGKQNGTFMLQPIFYGKKQFGYFVCKIKSSDYVFTLVYQKVYSTVISQAYIYTQQFMENKKLTTENIKLQLSNSVLAEQSINDPLTKILNRRGFIDAGQDAINLSLKMNVNGLVCFGDMDNLKVINDTYGHEMGDKALQVCAEVLHISFRKSDVCGRLGGDEFAAVLPGLEKKDFNKLRNKYKIILNSLITARGLPFNISISIGFVEFNKENKNLNELLKKADELQYIEKHKKHAGRK